MFIINLHGFVNYFKCKFSINLAVIYLNSLRGNESSYETEFIFLIINLFT